MVGAKVKWTGGMAFRGSSASGHELVMDASRESGGDDAGPRPTELVLMATGGCSAIDVVSILGKMQVAFDSLEVEMEAERADDHPKVFTRVTMVYKLEGPEIPADKVRRAVELSLDKYCTVSNMINKTAEIHHRIEINGEAIAL